MFLGNFRQYKDTYVSYLCVVFVGILLFPIGCYRIKEDGNDKYLVYGSVKWFWLEIVCIYIQYFSLIIGGLSVLYTIVGITRD